jgi:hypothetical protein
MQAICDLFVTKGLALQKACRQAADAAGATPARRSVIHGFYL